MATTKPVKKRATQPKPKSPKRKAPKRKALLKVAKKAFAANLEGPIYAATLEVLQALLRRATRKPEVAKFLELAIAEVLKGGGQDGGDGPSQGPGEKVGGGD